MGILLASAGIFEVVANCDETDCQFKVKTTCVPCPSMLKAQALKVLDELEKPCPHQYKSHSFIPPIAKSKCSDCIIEIRKELEGKNADCKQRNK